MIYLNNSSTTKPTKEVLQDFIWCANNYWANPSDISTEGIKAKQIITHAQNQIGSYIGASGNEIVFTSGASESNNWAIKGFLEANKLFSCIITTKIEHPSVYNTCQYLGKNGYRVEYAPIDNTGKVDIDEFRKLISMFSPFCFVSIMMGNNEIGTLNDIEEIAKITHEYGGYLHVDAVQTFGKIPINVEKMGIDMMSASFHKFGGLKNCGFLYIKNDLKISPLIHGGHQFDGRRAGTENVPAIYALGNQVERMDGKFPDRSLIDYLFNKIYELCSSLNIGIYLNGHPTDCLPNLFSITFKGINAESLITLLDMKGVCVSAGSACCAGEQTPSRVLKAIGLTDEEALCTIRISTDESTTVEECDGFITVLKECLEELKMIGEG